MDLQKNLNKRFLNIHIKEKLDVKETIEELIFQGKT